MENGECVSEFVFEGDEAENLYLSFAVILFIVYYAVPCACFFILYGMVVISMQRRKRDSQFESNRLCPPFIFLFDEIKISLLNVSKMFRELFCSFYSE